jgi:hypothetical protein
MLVSPIAKNTIPNPRRKIVASAASRQPIPSFLLVTWRAMVRPCRALSCG